MRYWAWFWVIILGAAGLIWYGFIRQIILHKPFGNNPGPDWMIWIIFLLFGIGLPLAVYVLKLVTTIDARAIHIRYFPFYARTIPLSQVETCEACEYNALRDYGGWGVRWSPRNGWTYSVSGRHGVRLEMKDGKRIMMGSHESEQLATAVQSALLASARRQ